ncbi:MAG: CoA-binding protein [Actinomycetota bacterium]
MEIGRFNRDFEGLFNPRSIALVGASNVSGKWGFIMPMNILGGGFRGRLYLVNPNEQTVLGMPCYDSLSAIGKPVDLAILTIPARKVITVVEEAAACGIRNVLVVASNFSEAGPEGAKLERELASTANRLEVTIIGPNTMGLYSAESSLCALGAPVLPRKGRIGFVSQSGNLGVQLLSWGKKRGVGFSRFVGSGNEANTETTDYLEFLGRDDKTNAIALYIEGLEDGRRFLEVASRITPHKPVLVLKGGKGEQGSRAALSHSGAMAGTLELFEGMFDQSGIVTAETSEEFLDLVSAFSSLPLPAGDGVAVVTMGGGWGVVAADACDREGIGLAKLPGAVVGKLDEFLPSYWSRANPVDLVGNLRRVNHFKVIEALMECDDVDILVIMGPTLGREFVLNNMLFTFLRPLYRLARSRPLRIPGFLMSMIEGFNQSVAKKDVRNPEGSVGIDPTELRLWTNRALIDHLQGLMKRFEKPIILVSISETAMADFKRLESHGIFTTSTPEEAVHIAAKLARYARFVAGSGAAVGRGEARRARQRKGAP